MKMFNIAVILVLMSLTDDVELKWESRNLMDDKRNSGAVPATVGSLNVLAQSKSTVVMPSSWEGS